ncbi:MULTISPECIES: hypothetical protein [unclassified Motilimonas]|uniref:hypothetical protein n=1 Tax=unclassified Motilimonas TaxID=2643697 RepID=UPI001E4602EE|nr:MULTISPECIES: hypothetical protein [unclassified Motilimonas]MCE0558530.1 hypothetical protein [Motilimonas sp. E26]MDO6527417.1 hypothetical protein [Motilimonas sp. 1_MG-2023]
MAFEALKQTLATNELQAELDKPIVQWGLFLSLCIVLWALFFQPILDWRSASIDEISQAQLQRSKEKSLLNSQLQLQKSLGEYKNWLTLSDKAYLQGRSEGSATSNLVVILEKKFKPLAITFSSRRFVPAKVIPWVGEKIETRWVLKGNADNLIDFMHQVAGHSPELLVIDQAEFRRVTSEQFELSVNIYAFKAMSEKNLLSESNRLEALQ